MTGKMPAAVRKPAALSPGYAGIHGGIVELLNAARQTAARSALYMAAIVAMRHNPVIRTCYERQVTAGKPEKVAIVACIRELLIILNAMVRIGKPWKEGAAPGWTDAEGGIASHKPSGLHLSWSVGDPALEAERAIEKIDICGACLSKQIDILLRQKLWPPFLDGRNAAFSVGPKHTGGCRERRIARELWVPDGNFARKAVMHDDHGRTGPEPQVHFLPRLQALG